MPCAGPVPSRRAASGRFGVSTAARGSNVSASAATASSCNSASPDFATITGSRTTGTSPGSRSATAQMIGAENSMPILIAPTARSSSTASICAPTIAGETASTAVTSRVFCAVIAVTTLAP